MTWQVQAYTSNGMDEVILYDNYDDAFAAAKAIVAQGKDFYFIAPTDTPERQIDSFNTIHKDKKVYRP